MNRSVVGMFYEISLRLPIPIKKIYKISLGKDNGRKNCIGNDGESETGV
jgi:hypothetical protein